ncbi:microsomal signal peptidase 25 kDa subunit-domain-containing protein [Neurospora tetraspora]|uniref:Signal peptidase complex subunit 2 n=1 Tax=Neurospora tetraspora TaxID=94610 RepID=A0AAE0JQ98_9PEZI|nr:microsomal signal peptidase 25 kDa subunit-domain-containing protein [Neurospora tetraspora]
MASTEKITVYNVADLRATTDDALLNYLNSLGLRQSHTLLDTRLALGFSAFLLSAACFAWDYKLGFESTKQYTLIAVILYTLLNGALTYWIMFVEQGTIYAGSTKDGKTRIRVISDSKKPQQKGEAPLYKLRVDVEDVKTKKVQKIELERRFSEWFDASGRFVAAPFQTVLAQGIPLVGRLDPKRAVAAAPASGGQGMIKEQFAETPGYTAEILDAIASGLGESSTTAATGFSANQDAGKKRRK